MHAKVKYFFKMFNCHNCIENAHVKANKISLLKHVNNTNNSYLNK